LSIKKKTGNTIVHFLYPKINILTNIHPTTSAPSYLFHDCLRKPDFTQARTPLHAKYNIVRPLGR
jgi:hypothetical protein